MAGRGAVDGCPVVFGQVWLVDSECDVWLNDDASGLIAYPGGNGTRLANRQMSGAIIVFGSGGHAKVLIEALLATAPGRLISIVDDDGSAAGRSVLGRPVVGNRQWLAKNLPGAPVAVGVGINSARTAIIEWLDREGRSLETIIHPSAIVSPSAELGEGVFLAAGSIVLAEARIGRGTIINTGASVDHDCRVGEGAHIGPGVRLCGGVSIGNRSLVGVGSVVAPGVKIGADVIVGAGSAVIRDLAHGGRFAGRPARPIR